MPNFASLYHSGASYFWSDSQSGRKGPRWPAASTCLSSAARSPSYLLLAFCQIASIASGSIEAVGAVGLWACAPGSAKSASKKPPSAIANSERASMISLSCSRNRVLMPSIHGDHDLLEACRILAPRSQGIRRLFERHHQTHSLVHRKLFPLEKMDYRTKIFRQRVSRTENVQLFLHEESRLIAYRFFCIADVHHSSREGDFFNSGSKGLRCSDRFDHHIRAATFRQFLQAIV